MRFHRPHLPGLPSLLLPTLLLLASCGDGDDDPTGPDKPAIPETIQEPGVTAELDPGNNLASLAEERRIAGPWELEESQEGCAGNSPPAPWATPSYEPVEFGPPPAP